MITRKAGLTAALFLFLSNAFWVQTPPPASDIFLTSWDGQRTGVPSNITRRDGYDNQPSFFPDGRALLFTSIRDGQADIHRYDIESRETSRVTSTPESEYSPTVEPDGINMSVVRVEQDSTQRLWRFPLAGGPPSLVLTGVKPVGYHAWLDPTTLALFILGEPNTLQIVETGSEKARVAAENIGRSIHRIPGRQELSFLHREAADRWVIKSLDPASGVIESLVQTPAGREDFAWTPDGSILMGDDSRLIMWRPGDTGWSQVADFAPHGIKGITRIAVSPAGNRVAFVAVQEN